MGGGSTQINNNSIDGQGLPKRPQLECSSAKHIATQKFITTYPFPLVTHLGIQSTKIIPTDGQFLGKW
jgi:hypothetical protein